MVEDIEGKPPSQSRTSAINNQGPMKEPEAGIT
jgi:hypothetical protein